jgi:hypothetical protein
MAAGHENLSENISQEITLWNFWKSSHTKKSMAGSLKLD